MVAGAIFQKYCLANRMTSFRSTGSAGKSSSHRPGVDVTITIFYDFSQFSAKKFGVFLKNHGYDQFLQKLVVV
jgi:hypothetical protein